MQSSRGSSIIGYSREMRSVWLARNEAHVLRAAIVVAVMAAALVVATPRAQEVPPDFATRQPFDQILDLYVRDGLVYYRALKIERAKLDRYVDSLANTDVDKLSRDARLAFWLNAYDAFVLQTVIDHYPIRGHAPGYPADSIRQIPGAFERTPHRAGHRTLTLDQIEQMVLPEFHDPRVYFALGRGAVGGGRLRSEAFAAASLDRQLSEAVSECTTRSQCVEVDRDANTVVASPIFSWRERDFIDTYAGKAPAVFGTRSPIERAIIAFVGPSLLASERALLETNTFHVAYSVFDWSLNDLTGRGGR
jgi:hypothetical protein